MTTPSGNMRSKLEIDSQKRTARAGPDVVRDYAATPDINSPSSIRSRRLVVSCRYAWRRFVVSDAKQTVDRLDPPRSAPSGDERARNRHVGEIDRDGIIDDAPDTARGQRPTIRAGILVEPITLTLQLRSKSERC